MKYIVYLTTNIKNNKIYVGVHKTEIPEVFDGYIGNGINRNAPSCILHPTTPFQYAVKKYGFDSFKRSIIKIFDTLEEALILESEIVNEEFIKRTDTYNITLGGGMPPIHNKIIYQYDLKGNFIKKWDSIHEAASNLKINESSIGKSAMFKRTGGNYLWSYEKYDLLNISEYNVYIPEIPVYVYDENGNLTSCVKSMSECAKLLDSNLSHIQRSIKTGVKVKGYNISLNLTSVYVQPKLERLCGKVHQYDLDGNYITSYNSIKEVENKFGETMQGINPSIKLGEQYKGYLWLRGVKQDFVKPYKTPKCSAKKIGQYSEDGKLIKVFNTLREARKEFPNVSKVLNGMAKHCHGFKFKYEE